MNWRLVLHILGALAIVSAAAMLPSLGLAWFGEETAEAQKRAGLAFSAGVILSAGLGLLLWHLTRQHGRDRIGAAEGFAVASLGWMLMALLGAVPMVLCRHTTPMAEVQTATNAIPSPGPLFSFTDAFFESMSGFTTTGSSVFGTARDDLGVGGNGLIEQLPRSFLLWRSLTHWLGGMGIVVLCLAILPALRAGGYQMFQAEVPGPTAERLRPRIRETAAILWGVYLLLTAAETLLLWLGSMPLLDSLCHTFGTMATGGFSTKDASIGHYAATGHPSALWFEIVIDIFMFLAGANFLLHFKALHGDVKAYARDAEFRFYIIVLGAAILFFTLLLRLTGGAGSAGEALRASVFQVLSITTTTGFGTDDFNAWPAIGRMLMLCLMFFGGCAGSTGGGLKQIRIMVAWKYVHRELLRLLRPQLANRLRVGETTLEERTVGGIIALVLLYGAIFVIATGLVLATTGSLHATGATGEDAHLVTSASAVIATLNNIGPGLSGVGSTTNFGWLPGSTKLILEPVAQTFA